VAASQEDEDGEQQSSKRRRRHPSWQSAALQVLRPPSLQALTVHFRRRLDPLPLSVLPGYRVQRVLGILARLRPLVAPRVIAAYLRTVCDGWMTLKRFQQRGPCRFCGREIDSLRHIARCTAANRWAHDFCHLQRPPVGAELDFLLCIHDEALHVQHSLRPLEDSSQMLRARALYLYALCRLRNGIRNHRHVDSNFGDAFRMYLSEGALASE